jgi:hypothetical protein
MDEPADGDRRRPGSEPERVKIDTTFEEAVRRAMKAGKPADRPGPAKVRRPRSTGSRGEGAAK